jgi:hypothetical protein
MEPPRFLEPPDVTGLSAALLGIDLDRAFSSLPSDPQAMKDTLGGILTEFIGDPRDYLTEHFSALRDFYTAAADQDLAIVIWCA